LTPYSYACIIDPRSWAQDEHALGGDCVLGAKGDMVDSFSSARAWSGGKTVVTGEARLRVFVSYSHNDREAAVKLVSHLESQNVQVLWDKSLLPGAGFTEHIQRLIAHSRAFLALVTPAANEASWVHQETGYALGLNLPIVPIRIGALPKGMTQFTHACEIKKDMSDVAEILPTEKLKRIVTQAERENPPLFECARDHTKRGVMMKKYAEAVSDMGYSGLVRQRGALTSFHIPNVPIWHRHFRERYDGDLPQDSHLESLLAERRALDAHVRAEGCRLIVEPLAPEYVNNRGIASWVARVKQLVAFLEAMPDDKVTAAVVETDDTRESLTLVGDWFSAEAVTADSRGFRHTIFTRQVHLIREQIEAFDLMLDDELAEADIPAAQSRRAAIQRLNDIVKQRTSAVSRT
jgi:hypothetical protein